MQVQNGKYAVHPQEMENRLAYAYRLIAWIRGAMPSARAANLTSLREGTWESMAVQAGENPPGVATISTIIAIMAEQERAAAAMADALKGSLSEPPRLLGRYRETERV
jgi:hypothetical protein